MDFLVRWDIAVDGPPAALKCGRKGSRASSWWREIPAGRILLSCNFHCQAAQKRIHVSPGTYQRPGAVRPSHADAARLHRAANQRRACEVSPVVQTSPSCPGAHPYPVPGTASIVTRSWKPGAARSGHHAQARGGRDGRAGKGTPNREVGGDASIGRRASQAECGMPNLGWRAAVRAHGGRDRWRQTARGSGMGRSSKSGS